MRVYIRYLLCKLETHFIILVGTYFTGLYSILILYEWPPTSTLNDDYINSFEKSIKELENAMFPISWVRVPVQYKEDLIDFNLTRILHANVELGLHVMYIHIII